MARTPSNMRFEDYTVAPDHAARRPTAHLKSAQFHDGWSGKESALKTMVDPTAFSQANRGWIAVELLTETECNSFFALPKQDKPGIGWI